MAHSIGGPARQWLSGFSSHHRQLQEQKSSYESELASLRSKNDREARELIEQVNDEIATIEA